MSATARPWVALFDDGPCAAGPDHVFVVGPPWCEIELAPMPREVNIDHWVIVGGDQMGPCEHPWPGQVTYRLVHVVIAEGADDVAHYSVVEGPSEAPSGTRATDAGSKSSAR